MSFMMSASVSDKFGTISSHCVTVTVGIAAHTVHVTRDGASVIPPRQPVLASGGGFWVHFLGKQDPPEGW